MPLKTNIELGDVICYKNSKRMHIITGVTTRNSAEYFQYILRKEDGIVYCPTTDQDKYKIPLIYESWEQSMLAFMYNNKGYFLDYSYLKVVYKNGEYSIATSYQEAQRLR